jgi:predicted dehydrogenase
MIKLGIIGAGAIGAHHTATAKRVGVEVVGVADVNETAARALAQKEGVAVALADPLALLAIEDIDAVVVGVPNKFHKDLALAAMRAGKDVLLEKPMAMNVAECREINAEAKAQKRIVQIGFVHRFTTVAQTAKRFIDDGTLGTIYHAKANMYRRRGIPGLGGWFTTKQLSGGGPLIDLGVHVIDLAMHLMHFPRPLRVSGKVYANFGPRMKDYLYEGMWAGPPRLEGEFDVEDAAHALIRFEGGLTLETNVTWAGNFPENALPSLMGFFGDKGGLTFQLGGNEVRIATEANGHNVDLVPKLRPAEHADDQLRHFVECVRTRKEPITSGEKGQVVQALIDAIYRSSEQDREVEVEV